MALRLVHRLTMDSKLKLLQQISGLFAKASGSSCRGAGTGKKIEDHQRSALGSQASRKVLRGPDRSTANPSWQSPAAPHGEHEVS